MHTLMRMSRWLAVVGAVALVLSGLGAEVAEAKSDGHRHGTHHERNHDKNDKKRDRKRSQTERGTSRSTSDEVTGEWFRFYFNPDFVNVVQNNTAIING